MSTKSPIDTRIVCTRCKNTMKCMPQNLAKAKKRCVYCGKNLKIKDLIVAPFSTASLNPKNSPPERFYQAPKKAEFIVYRAYNGTLTTQDL